MQVDCVVVMLRPEYSSLPGNKRGLMLTDEYNKYIMLRPDYSSLPEKEV